LLAYVPELTSRSPGSGIGTLVAKSPVPRSRYIRFPGAQDKKCGKILLEDETTTDSTTLTSYSDGTTTPNYVAKEEDIDASEDKQAALIVEATTKALLWPALQEALARVQELEEKCDEALDHNKELADKYALESLKVQQLEERVKEDSYRIQQLTAKCMSAADRAQQIEEELLEEQLRQMKTSSASDANQKVQLEVALTTARHWAPSGSGVMETGLSNDYLLNTYFCSGKSALASSGLVR
jgi:hypothetical protein